MPYRIRDDQDTTLVMHPSRGQASRACRRFLKLRGVHSSRVSQGGRAPWWSASSDSRAPAGRRTSPLFGGNPWSAV